MHDIMPVNVADQLDFAGFVHAARLLGSTMQKCV